MFIIDDYIIADYNRFRLNKQLKKTYKLMYSFYNYINKGYAIMENKELLDIVNHFIYFIRYNKIKNAVELKKFVYTRNFSSEDIKKYKDLFSLYGEMNVYNCIISFVNGSIESKQILIEKIKGVI